MVELVFENVLYYCFVQCRVYLMRFVEECHGCLSELRIGVEQKVDYNFEEILFVSERVV